MQSKKSVPAVAMIDMAILNSKYNTRKSKINKKWTRYLKNKKLFDEYMIYLSNYKVVGVEPKTYKQLSNLCFNLNRKCFFVQDEKWKTHHIIVNWLKEFHTFAWKSIKWYDIKNILLYWINNGYK